MQIEKFNESLEVWINELNKFTLEQLLKKPDEKNWSLGQVYMHIIEEAHWYNDQCKLTLSDTENADKPLTENAKIFLKPDHLPIRKFRQILRFLIM